MACPCVCYPVNMLQWCWRWQKRCWAACFGCCCGFVCAPHCCWYVVWLLLPNERARASLDAVCVVATRVGRERRQHTVDTVGSMNECNTEYVRGWCTCTCMPNKRTWATSSSGRRALSLYIYIYICGYISRLVWYMAGVSKGGLDFIQVLCRENAHIVVVRQIGLVIFRSIAARRVTSTTSNV